MSSCESMNSFTIPVIQTEGIFVQIMAKSLN